MPSDIDIAFPALDEQTISTLERWGRVRDTTAGEILISQGDRGFPFFVVLEGAVDVVENTSDGERHVATHTPGQFSGDSSMISGRSSLVTTRVSAAGRVLEIEAAQLRRVVSELPDTGEILLRAFLMRRTILPGSGYTGLRIIGSRFDSRAHELRDFATRNEIPFTWLDLELDQQAESLLCEFGVAPADTPVVLGPNGVFLTNPTVEQLAECAGLASTLDASELYDVVVVGAGPAGLAASVYAASEGLRVLTLDAVAAGGQAGTSSRIDNYLGFAAGVSGAELTRQALLQAQKFGALVMVPRRVTALRLEAGLRILELDDGSVVSTRCVLVASGAQYRHLDVPGIRKYDGAGVYYAATDLEARLCRGEVVVVVGGGNSAGQAAVQLSRSATEVHLVIRSDDLGKSMSRYLEDRVEGIDTVQVHRSTVVSQVGGNGHLEQVTLRRADGSEVTIGTSALFLFVGASPHTAWLGDCVELDRRGFVLTGASLSADIRTHEGWRTIGREPLLLESSVPGVFVAGDVRSGSVKRVASAVGEGAMAVSMLHRHIGSPT